MKTSNKIILGIITFIGLSMLSVLIFAKSSLINIENDTVEGDGKIIKVNHNIGEIAFFKSNDHYEVYIKKGSPELIIETDENIQSFLNPNFYNTAYNNKEGKSIKRQFLTIGWPRQYNLKPTQKIKIYLTSPTFERIELGGSTKLIFEDVFDVDHFEAELNDFSEVNLKVNTPSLDIEIDDSAKLDVQGTVKDTEINADDFAHLSIDKLMAKEVLVNSEGNCNIQLKGNTQLLKIKTTGFSKVNARELTSSDIEIEAKDNTETLTNATKTLRVDAADFASVKYNGTPEVVKNISNQASIRAMQ